MNKNLKINIALSPNSSFDEVKFSLTQLLFPWNWASWSESRKKPINSTRKNSARQELEETFASKFGFDQVHAVGSGREALYLILKALNLPQDSEVVLQSFTCMVVTNSILWNGLKPVYADINSDNYNLTVESLKKVVTDKTKVIIVQHTFGIPAEIAKIKEYCLKEKIFLVEDCAHAMGAIFENDYLGKFGDIAFFSLGRSKVISAINGGLIALNKSKNIELSKKLIHEFSSLKTKSKLKIWQDLNHPIVMELAKSLKSIPLLQKAVLKFAQKIKLINLEVTGAEKQAQKSQEFPVKLSEVNSKMALIQLAKLDRFNQRRKAIAQKYYDNLNNFEDFKMINPAENQGAIWLRYPLQTKKAADIFQKARNQGIILGDWYNTPVAPKDIDQSKSEYIFGSAKTTEEITKRILNLPTHFSLKDQEIDQLIQYIKSIATK